MKPIPPPALISATFLMPPKTAVIIAPMKIRMLSTKTIMDVCPVFFMSLPMTVTLHIKIAGSGFFTKPKFECLCNREFAL